MEADIAPKNKPENVDFVDGSLGELSLFHETHGFYVHGVTLETAVLPDGWRDRLIKIQNQNTNQYTGWCIEGHDLAASKLVAFRDKDRSFVRVLLAEQLVDAATLRTRIDTLAVSRDQQERLTTWVEATRQELN